ncbi:MAG: heme-binding protein [Flavobacterium sp.]|nr:heme-binding protein [Flavobacterium sp.]
MNITLKQAQQIVMEAMEFSEKKNFKMNITIVDSGANPVAFARMDGAWLGSADISLKKAKTAVFFQMDTKEISPLVQPGKPLYAIEHSNNGLITFPGGMVIKNADGNMIGAIGVSGGSVDEDHSVAEAAIKGFSK